MRPTLPLQALSGNDQDRKLDGAFDGSHYKLSVIQDENAKEEKQSGWHCAAKQIGLTIPQSVLYRADKVIR